MYAILSDPSRGSGGCAQGSGIAPRILEKNVKIYPTFYEKSFKEGSLKQNIEKRALLPFSLSLLRYWRGK